MFYLMPKISMDNKRHWRTMVSIVGRTMSALHTVTGANFFDSEEDNREKTGRVFRDPNDNDAATQTGPVTNRINAIRSELNLPTRYIYGSTPSTLYYEVDGTKKQIRYTKQSIPDFYKNKKVKQ